MSVTLADANTYFETHLDADYWAALTEAKRTAALAMAEKQIAAVSGTQECPDAVCEQAVWLIRNHDNQTAGRIVTGQTLEGMGSQSFELLGSRTGRYAGIAPAAELLLKALPRGPVTFGRG